MCENNYSEHIARLPYLFKDTVQFDKKVDPKKLQFGSRIDKKSGVRQEYFIVKEVISPERLLLNNKLKVRLIGVREDREKNGRAIKYLTEKLKGQQVFLKFDSVKYDSENNLLCYLYLKNKTFVNAHLLKDHMVNVDIDAEYRHKQRFMKYRGACNG